MGTSTSPSRFPGGLAVSSGCFWGAEHSYLKKYKNKGIISTRVGFTGGKPEVVSPSYKEVCTGETDHVEAVYIEFDPSVLPFKELVGEQSKWSRLK